MHKNRQEHDYSQLGYEYAIEKKIIKEIEQQLNRKQTEIIATLLPDVVLNISGTGKNYLKTFVGVLLFADVSGFTSLCEKYAETGKGGVYRLTATLNGYIGAIVEVIYFFGGDVLKFSGDAFLAIWNVNADTLMFQVIHEVISCGLFIQEMLGTFETEVHVLLRVKIAISCGNLQFAIIGDDKNRHYLTVGKPIQDVKCAEHNSIAGDVVLSPSAWGHCAADRYEIAYTPSKHVKILKILYKPNELHMRKELSDKCIRIAELCEKHIFHSRHIRRKKTAADSENDSTITDKFIRGLPVRSMVKDAVENFRIKHLRPFIIRPVMQQIDERQPLEYLTEMRDLTIMFVNVKPQPITDYKLIVTIDIAYKKVCSIVSKRLGCVNKVSLFDKDVMILVVYGLRGIKHELESQNALKSAFTIQTELNYLEGVKSVSVGVTSGLVYCGVVGHPFRHEYTVIGGSVNKAARIMCAYEGKVTCDQKTYKYSKLSSCYFSLQKPKWLKGILNVGNIFEYNEEFKSPPLAPKETRPILGRHFELDLVQNILSKAYHQYAHNSIIFSGESKIGKTRLMKEIFRIASIDPYITASLSAKTGVTTSPYQVAFQIFEQIYDENNKINVDSGRTPENDDLGSHPSEYWTFKDLLTVDLYPKQHRENIENSRQAKIVELFNNLLSRVSCCTVIIDDLHFIDVQSWHVFDNIIQHPSLTMFATITSERELPSWVRELQQHLKITVIVLEGIDPRYVAPLACQFLKVSGIPQKLELLLRASSEGRPGWIQSCLLRLINNGNIEIIHISDKLTTPNTNFPAISDIMYMDSEMGGNSQKTSPEQSYIMPVAILGKNFDITNEDKTIAEISLDLFDSFTPYEQLILKVGAVLGETFTSFMLKRIMQETPLICYLQAVKHLFDEQVLECETLNIKIHQFSNFIKDSGCCACFFEDEMNHINMHILKRCCIPKYAFCKLLRFKNNHLRTIAYELLPVNQKKEMHSRIVDLLEGQNNICPSCSKTSSSIFKVPVFTEFLATLGLVQEQCDVNLPPKKPLDPPNFLELQEIIKQHVHHSEGLPDAFAEPETTPTATWDSSNCTCGPILARVYYQLIKHSSAAEILGKHIYFLIQQATILIIMGEHSEAIKFLKEASELCLKDEHDENPNLTPLFRKILFGRSHTFLGNAYMELRQFNASKIHLAIALRQYNMPMMSLKYKMPNMFQLSCFRWYHEKYPMLRSIRCSAIKGELGRCLFLVSMLMLREGNISIAKKAATKSLYILQNLNTNLFMLCDAYSNAIDIFNFTETTHMCELLEKSANQAILLKYSDNNTMELLSIGKLLTVCFTVRFLRGKIRESLRLGYRAFEINYKLQARNVQVHVMSILTFALILRRRIDEAVVVINNLYMMREGKFDQPSLWYHALCLDLYLDSSFVHEKMQACRNFANKYFFEKDLESIRFVDVEKLIIANMFLYNCRVGNWAEAIKWRGILSTVRDQEYSIHFIHMILKYVQSLLLIIVNEYNYNRHSQKIPQLEAKVEKLFVQIRDFVSMWKLFLPRYMHLKAYYARIKGQKSTSNKLLKNAEKFAVQHENALEMLWLETSKSSWSTKYNTQHAKFWGEVTENLPLGWYASYYHSADEIMTLLYSLPLPVAYRTT